MTDKKNVGSGPVDKQVDKAANEAKSLIDRASNETKKLADDAKKGLEKGEGHLQQFWAKLKEWVTQASDGTVHIANAGSEKAVETAKVVVSRACVELQNPVVSVNVAVGTGAVAAALYGYAEHQARYLKGKSDKVILATVGGVTALALVDGILSYRYYRQFDKKGK